MALPGPYIDYKKGENPIRRPGGILPRFSTVGRVRISEIWTCSSLIKKKQPKFWPGSLSEPTGRCYPALHAGWQISFYTHLFIILCGGVKSNCMQNTELAAVCAVKGRINVKAVQSRSIQE